MKSRIIDAIHESIGEEFQVLVLRGNDHESRVGGDIDVLVPVGFANTACYRLHDFLKGDGWKLLSHRDIGYLATITLVLITDEESYSIKIDFFAGLEWRGVGSGVTSSVFFDRMLPEAVAQDRSDELAATVNFLQKCMYKGYLSERDRSRIAVPSATVVRLATELGLRLPDDGVPRGVGLIARWQLRYQTGSASTIGQFASWWTSVLWCAISSRFGRAFGSSLVVTLSGMDGSGKTTQLNLLMDHYASSGMEMPIHIHFLPAWIPLPHQLFGRKKTEENYLRPYSEAPTKSKLSEFVRIVWYLVCFSLSKGYVCLQESIGKVVVMDRSFIDLSVDFSRVKLPHRQLGKFWINALTNFGLNIYLDVDPDVAVTRKNEIDIDKATILKVRYLETFEKIGGTVVDANQSPARIHREIMALVDDHFGGRLQTKVGVTG